jgi:hypothetical protein
LTVIIIHTLTPNNDWNWHTVCCWKCQKLTKISNKNMPIIWHFCRAVLVYITPLQLVCCVNPIERGGFECFHKRKFPVPGFFTYCRDSFIGCYVFSVCVCVCVCVRARAHGCVRERERVQTLHKSYNTSHQGACKSVNYIFDWCHWSVLIILKYMSKLKWWEKNESRCNNLNLWEFPISIDGIFTS